MGAAENDTGGRTLADTEAFRDVADSEQLQGFTVIREKTQPQGSATTTPSS